MKKISKTVDSLNFNAAFEKFYNHAPFDERDLQKLFTKFRPEKQTP